MDSLYIFQDPKQKTLNSLLKALRAKKKETWLVLAEGASREARAGVMNLGQA